ncbi:MAG: VOC family protein [Hyphomonadaceae bacterium]
MSESTADRRPGLSPYLGVRGAAAAIDFYKKAFNAEEIARAPAEDGKRLMHAHIKINGGDVLMSDVFEEFGHDMSDPHGVTIHLQVDDADAWWNRAIAAGAMIAMPLDNQFWGDRYGQLRDPFGHSWSIGGPIKT